MIKVKEVLRFRQVPYLYLTVTAVTDNIIRNENKSKHYIQIVYFSQLNSYWIHDERWLLVFTLYVSSVGEMHIVTVYQTMTTND